MTDNELTLGRAQCAIEGAVATITLHNPARRNAVGWQLFEDLRGIVADLSASDEVHVAVIVGAGKDFSVGADMAAPLEGRTLRRDSIEADTRRLTEVSRTVAALNWLPQVTIAAIEGGCAGAGLSLALTADFRVAGVGAAFNTAFLDVALSGDLGGAWFLTRIVGVQAARKLMLNPGRITADAALEFGLIDRVCESGAAFQDARAWAAELATKAPLALREIKQNLISAETTSLEQYLPGEVDRMVACFHSADAQEAARAFTERRIPTFDGQ